MYRMLSLDPNFVRLAEGPTWEQALEIRRMIVDKVCEAMQAYKKI